MKSYLQVNQDLLHFLHIVSSISFTFFCILFKTYLERDRHLSIVKLYLSASCSKNGATSSAACCQSLFLIFKTIISFQFSAFISGPGQPVWLSALFNKIKLGFGQLLPASIHIRSNRSLPFVYFLERIAWIFPANKDALS